MLPIPASIPTYVDGRTTAAYTDNIADTAIDTARTLYTQGERGGISGLLPNDEAPPCRFMCAGADRVLAGGLEDPTKVQWSRPIFPGEPIQWSILESFTTNVDEEVTGVGQLDGSWFIFTEKSIWVVGGSGPDDENVGSFSVPVKLPSDSGCINHRSIVESPQGLFFQGKAGNMYLLPRGGSAPQWVGRAMQDTFADVFIVAGTLLRKENCIAWACNGAGGAFKVVVYDTIAGEWMVDQDTGGVWSSNRKTVDVYDGKLIIDGSIAETDAFIDNHDGSTPQSITMSLTLGDIRPFGPMGFGRVRKLVTLGAHRELCRCAGRDILRLRRLVLRPFRGVGGDKRSGNAGPQGAPTQVPAHRFGEAEADGCADKRNGWSRGVHFQRPIAGSLSGCGDAAACRRR